MKLALILFFVFVYTVAVSIGIAAGASELLSARGVAVVGITVVPPVLSSLLALWTTMTGRRPLWQSVGVMAIAVAWECNQAAGSGMQGFAIPVIACFVAAVVPFLFIRASGFTLVDAGARSPKFDQASSPTASG